MEIGGTKRSLLSSLVYSLGFTIQRAIGLILLPVYTSVLSPAEYGDIGLLMAVYTGTGVIFGLGMETVIVREYFQLADDPARRQRFVDSVWRFLIVFPTAMALVFTGVAWLLFGDSGELGVTEVGLTMAAGVVSIAATTLPMSILRARQDLTGYLWMTGVLAVAITGFTLLFVVGFSWGVKGWFLAMLAGNALLLGTALWLVPWHPNRSVDWRLVWGAVAFSLPLLPHFFSHWALQLADRGVIAGMVSRTDLGIYTLAANLASVLMMLVIALNQGFTPLYARAGAEQGLVRQLRETVALQIALVVSLTLGVATLGPPLIEVLTPAAFHEAAPLIPWLAVAYGLMGLYFIPMNGATLGAGRRGWAWLMTLVSAGLNILLLYLLVPEYGIEAAAWSSAAGYLALLVLISLWAHSGANPVTYDWKRIAPTVALGAVVYWCSTVPSVADPAADLVVQTGFVAIFVVGLAALLFRAQTAGVLNRVLGRTPAQT